jgi:hypothetical protein
MDEEGRLRVLDDDDDDDRRPRAVDNDDDATTVTAAREWRRLARVDDDRMEARNADNAILNFIIYIYFIFFRFVVS